jgi:hypothetical protein
LSNSSKQKIGPAAICAFYLFSPLSPRVEEKNFYSFIAPMKGPFLTPLPSLWEGEFSIMRCLAPLEPTNCCLPLFFPLFSPLFPHNFARKIAD